MVMERKSFSIGWLSALGFVFGLVLGGCRNAEDSCNCPAPGVATVEVPPGLSSPLVSVVVTPPCTTSDGHTDGGFTMYGGHDGGTGWLTIHVSGSDAVTCNVYATLADGTQLQTSVRFERRTGCCTGMVQGGYDVLQLVGPPAGDAGPD